MSSSFSPISLKRLEATTDGYYNIFLERIGERASQNEGVIDMNEWFHKLSFDVRPSESWINYRSEEPLL